jgi:S-adenosylmethionine:tRNA ribosyltransferase-isomerase
MISLETYDYYLPKELIATEPASPRDSSRLLVYDTASDTITFDTFLHLDKHLPQGTHLLINDTRVVPARLWLRRETGGKIQVLLFLNEYHPGDLLLKGIVDRKLEIGAKLFFEHTAFLDVVRQEEKIFFFRPSISIPKLFHLIAVEGYTPIPPYIKSTRLAENALRRKYQTIFAKHLSSFERSDPGPASVAAPTASLHFTSRVLKRLDARKDILRSFVTLHVGAGTFAPIGEENLRTRTLHREFCSVSRATAIAVNHSLDAGNPVIPIGTTALRTLENFAERYRDKYHLVPGATDTGIFIFPPYEFKIASGLITNFHVPRSSLMLLVDAMLEHKRAKRRILDIYRVAIRERFRFYSFGDAMLIR